MSDVINTEIIIVGGGIGGLAAALALANIDKHVCVLEQAAEIAEIGAGIQLGPNVYKMSVIEIPAGKQFKQQFGFPYAVIHRADLHGVLLKKCQTSDKIELRTGAKVTGIEESDTGTSVTTEQGLRVNGDALVGADGIWSTIRQHVVGDGDARVSGHVAYRAVIRLRWNSMCLWAGEKSHLVQYPMRGGELFNLVAVFHSDKFTQGWNDFGDNEELEHRFAGKCPEVLSLIGKIESWRMWVLSDREPTRDWVKGRITLLGDAAHPMLQYLAQGANMAIEDAICLADMLVNENGDYAKAFIRYRDARYLRTTRVQMQARLYGEIYHASGAVRDFRNDELASRSDEKFYTGMSWLYDIKPSWRDQ